MLFELKLISCSKEITVLRSFYRKYYKILVYFFGKFLDHHHQPKVPLNRKLTYVVLIVTLNSLHVNTLLH